MKVVGIIAEFNPFHKGHSYIVSKAKELTGADCCVVITSGNYVQRGEPSFVDKYTKTSVALKNGVDLVIELPVQFSTASAEYFATAAVTILHNMNIIDYLAFGTESDNIDTLKEIADILDEEPPEFAGVLKSELANGCSYPLARAKALKETTHIADIDYINTPNNILAIEYLKALKRLSSNIKPFAIKRVVAGYHEKFIQDNIDNHNRLYSASNIRNISNDRLISVLGDIDVEYLAQINKHFPIYLNNSFNSIAGQKLMQSITCGENIYFDVPSYLWDKIKNNIFSYTSYTEFIELLKTKEISYTAISRGLLHIILDIKTTDITEYKANNYGSYIRVLGFRKEYSSLLKDIDEHTDLSIITKVKDYKELLNPIAIRQFEQNLYADNMYQIISTIDYKVQKPNEYQRKLIVY